MRRRGSGLKIAEIEQTSAGIITKNDSDNYRDVVFDLDSQRAINRSLESSICSLRTRKDVFVHLTRKLDKFFSIHKASYSLNDPEKDRMRIPVVCQGGDVHSGVVISVDAKKSLMRKVLEDGRIYLEDLPEHVVGNIIERKLLLLSDTNSLAIVPMRVYGRLLGTMNFASPAPFAFSIFSSHLFDYLFAMVSQRFVELNS